MIGKRVRLGARISADGGCFFSLGAFHKSLHDCFLRSIGPSCVELNLSLTNSSFCDFPLMGGFLFKNIGKKRGKACLLKKLTLPLQSKNGVLAHLARARHWQCRGERFESAILHFVKANLVTLKVRLLFYDYN